MLFIIDVNTTNEETMQTAVESITALLSQKYKGVKVVGTAYSPKPKKAAVDLPTATPPKDAVEALPLLGDGLHYISKDDIEIYANAYPAIDPLAEIRKMKAWLHSNRKNRKTASGIKRFINGWLETAQNKAAKQPKNQKQGALSSFETDEFFDAALKHGMEKYGGRE